MVTRVPSLHPFPPFVPNTPTPFFRTKMFSTLVSSYPSWSALKAYLTSDEGGRLRVYDNSSPEYPYALIRYVKGQSNFSIPHVGNFRSVVWDTLAHRPVSVTPYKSEPGESLPIEGNPTNYRIEQFIDGVMIGVFYDKYNDTWELHTRSTLGARCRYYSQTRTFADLFKEAAGYSRVDLNSLDKTKCYTFVLRHPENRIVCQVNLPGVVLIQEGRVAEDAGYVDIPLEPSWITVSNIASWDNLAKLLQDWNDRFKYNHQGIVVKETGTGRRWKMRTAEYNRVRNLRGNSARRDFVWLSAWKSNTLYDYFRVYPEEKQLADSVIAQWKRVTNDVFHLYTDVFKARSLEKSNIPPKYRIFVFGIHTKYIEELKPSGRTVDWKFVLEYMNSRDIPLMLYAINWEKRIAAQQMGAQGIPFEPSASIEPTPTLDEHKISRDTLEAADALANISSAPLSATYAAVAAGMVDNS